MEFKRKVPRKKVSELKRTLNGVRRKYRVQGVLLGGISALIIVTAIWFGTDSLIDPEVNEMVLLDGSQYVRKHVVVNSNSQEGFLNDSQQNPDSPQGSGYDSDVTFGGHPPMWYFSCTMFEAQGNLACTQGHYRCGVEVDCSADTWYERASGGDTADAIGAFQFDYHYWDDEPIIPALLDKFPEEMAPFAHLATDHAASQVNETARDLHLTLCKLRNEHWKDFMDVQAALAYDCFIKPGVDGLSQITGGAVTWDNIHPALVATIMSVNVRNNCRYLPSVANINAGVARFHDALRACNGDQRKMIEASYDYIQSVRTAPSDVERYTAERVITLNMYDDPNFDVFATRTKQNQIVEYSATVGTAWGHWLGMEGY